MQQGAHPYAIDNIFKKIGTGLASGSERQNYLEQPGEYLELFGHPWYKQVEIVESVRDNQITVVRSSNDTGKTWALGGLLWWWLDVYGPYCKVITTAKNFKSVQFMLWTRIRQMYTMVRDRFNDAAINLTDFTPDPINHPDWFAIGHNPKIEGSLLDPESEAIAFQGQHSKHTLFIIDEAMTTHPAIFRAIEGSLLDEGARFLAVFNPTNKTGEVVGYENDPRANSIIIRAKDLFDSPEYKAHPEHYIELANKENCDKLEKAFGRNSPIVKARIYAEYPDQDEFSAINYGAVRDATERTTDFKSIFKVIYSWDVAGDNGADMNQIGRLTAGIVKDNEDELEDDLDKVKEPIVGLHYEIKPEWEWKKIKHKLSMEKVYMMIKEHMAKVQDLDIDFYLVVDAIGEGSHVPSFMEEWLPKLNVVSFKAGEKAQKIEERIEQEISNKISESWYLSQLLIQEDIKTWPQISMDIDKQTEHELTSRKYLLKPKLTIPQVWTIEEKKEWKKRNRGKSPDKADAYVMAIHCHFRSVMLKMYVV
ncbi:hypothetical protein LCGC14_0823360 [marine sediment metagenome]|uniref:Terminase large subunit n=1 Tax=marine sediment metagenome TaxID=412755 RepID=A0A0F9Q3D9_9ZZZZ|nr:hypothetical protein [Candidatus Scalindua sp.]